MVSLDEARELALALPEAAEQDHHGRPSFRVGGRIFATQWDADHVNVMLDEGGILTAVERDPITCEKVWWGKKLAAVRVDLRRAERTELAELLGDAWELRAPSYSSCPRLSSRPSRFATVARSRNSASACSRSLPGAARRRQWRGRSRLPVERNRRRRGGVDHQVGDGRVNGDLAIRLRGVVKRYGEITAVAGLDLDVPTGTCVGLLGPNGAGKSTTMRMLTGQTIADEGEVEVLGFALPEESKQARAQLGVSPQLDNLDVTLTVEQNLLVFTHLYRIGRSERREAIERALGMAKLADRRDSRVDKLSGGMRRRLLIARALVHRPRLVLLDEPTVGLDPQVRQELWALIDALRAEGTTILMSTHYIEEAQRLADTVMIMSHGRAVAAGSPAQLVAEHAGREVIEVYGPPAKLAEAEASARAAGLRTRRTGTSISVLGIDDLDGRAPAGERRPANLEDVFVLLTGEEIA
jgi:lipooligosaccharide transport system ATP-binding protein